LCLQNSRGSGGMGRAIATIAPSPMDPPLCILSVYVRCVIYVINENYDVDYEHLSGIDYLELRRQRVDSLS